MATAAVINVFDQALHTRQLLSMKRQVMHPQIKLAYTLYSIEEA